MITIILTILALQGQPKMQSQDCKCTYPLKQNTVWCTGPKGGQYCINRNGNKQYKPK